MCQHTLLVQWESFDAFENCVWICISFVPCSCSICHR
uniref:Uncharacterized protein n=1 Tax=Anguilla anguilla TaxID=7936 RepID=A0A0E9RSU6_ANGAN